MPIDVHEVWYLETRNRLGLVISTERKMNMCGYQKMSTKEQFSSVQLNNNDCRIRKVKQLISPPEFCFQWSGLLKLPIEDRFRVDKKLPFFLSVPVFISFYEQTTKLMWTMHENFEQYNKILHNLLNDSTATYLNNLPESPLHLTTLSKPSVFRKWVPVEMKLWGVFSMSIEKDLCFHWKNCS